MRRLFFCTQIACYLPTRKSRGQLHVRTHPASCTQRCGCSVSAASLTPAFAQLAASEKPHRIDVHHHFSPPAWIAAVKGRELLQRANTEWTPTRSIEDMDNAGVAAAIVSVTNPGLWLGDKEATRRIARECNEYGAKLVQDNPGRFGFSQRCRCRTSMRPCAR